MVGIWGAVGLFAGSGIIALVVCIVIFLRFLLPSAEDYAAQFLDLKFEESYDLFLLSVGLSEKPYLLFLQLIPPLQKLDLFSGGVVELPHIPQLLHLLVDFLRREFACHTGQ